MYVETFQCVLSSPVFNGGVKWELFLAVNPEMIMNDFHFLTPQVKYSDCCILN